MLGVAAILLALVTACGAQNSTGTAVNAQSATADAERSSQFNNPAQKAQLALERADCRVYGLRGYSISVPSLDLSLAEIRARYGLVVIPGTTETPRNQEEVDFNSAALRFARDYNAEIFRNAGEGCLERSPAIP